MSSAAKVGAKLTPRRMKVLQKRRDELLASLPAVGDLATGSADIDLIKGLCNLYSEPVYPQDMMDLIRALRQGAVESALGYDPQYLERAVAHPIGVSYMWNPWNFSDLVFRSGPVQPGSQTRSITPTVVTPAMDRKRGIAFIDRLHDGDSPNKSRRVDEHRAEHFGTRASNDGRSVPLETGLLRTRLGEPTVDTAAECECEDFLNDIVNGDVTPVRYDPAFAATPNTLKRKRDSSDRSELGKRALVKPLLRRRGNEGDVPHEKHPENPARQCNDTVAVGKDDTSKGLRFLHLSTGTASAGSLSDGLTQHDPPVSHAGGALPDQNLSPDQSEVERGTEITLSAKFRLDVESL
ncbi:hypothetical protein B0A54_17571, partial [Friedmanniomyces endolithicus]